MEKIKLKEDGMGSGWGKNLLVVIIVILVGLGSFGLGQLSKNGSGKPENLSAQVGQIGEYTGPVNDLIPLENTPSQSSPQATSTKAPATTKVVSAPPAPKTEKNFFASSRGSKYYPVNCSAGKTLKQENRIYFATGKQAEQAGYTLSNSCK